MGLFRPAVLVVLLSFAEVLVHAEDLDVGKVRPVVVKTVPEAGSVEIDPKLAEIKVTFSKEMRQGNWSWVIVTKESFPEMKGQPRYEKDKRTCVLPVELKPGKTYGIWLNSEKFKNFKDTDGRIAVPYLLVFRTKG